MSNIIIALEIIGTVAFAASGAMTAIKKNMDIFGVIILGLTTSIGGGAIRDIILGITPPTTFKHPLYAFVAIIVSIIVFLPFCVNRIKKSHKKFDVFLLLMDSVGLGVFTVSGIQTAYSVNTDNSAFLLIFVGVITGVGGGVLRDIMAGDTPYIFVKHFYATASFIGAIICVLLWNKNSTLAVTLGAAVIIILRLLAAKFRWKLPKYREKFEQ